MNRIRLFIILFFSLTSFACSQNTINVDDLLNKELNSGDALIFYLYHSGWAVKTQNNFLVFDYHESFPKPGVPSLLNGFINPNELQGMKVSVLVSHSHYDHYDPVIFNFAGSIENINYIFGWEVETDIPHMYFTSERGKRIIDDMVIYNIHHEFDNIPESAFLINVDGLTIYHAGDHGHSNGEANEIFKNNNDYLSGLVGNVDLLFTPTWGGEFYTIDKLAPSVVFPMHNGGHERQYNKFEKKVKDRSIGVKVGAAEKSGDCFFYSKGKLEKVEDN